uniref:Uncharacterized protein n=1 Tax=Phthorimaea operculella granulovirus TaxID=192584 RepID=A0A481SEG9_9BBAC|nr:hypothetical protein PhopGVgp092 [Phthorimaea operculella granulovirus]
MWLFIVIKNPYYLRNCAIDTIMKRYPYFEDCKKLTVCHFGRDDYYFKIKHLCMCLHLNPVKVIRRLNVNFYDKFGVLRQRYPGYKKEMLNPYTLMLHIDGLYEFLNTFCGRSAKKLMLKFVRNCLLRDKKFCDEKFRVFEVNDDVEDEMQKTQEEIDSATLNIVYGVLPCKVEFVKAADNEIYFMATDIASLIKCNQFNCVRRYVEDEDVVEWNELKDYLLDKYVIPNFENRYTANTIFLRPQGVNDMILAMMGTNTIFQNLCDEMDRYDENTPSPKYVPRMRGKKSTYKIPQADNSIITRIYKKLDVIMMPDKTVWLKLGQVIEHYRLSVKDVRVYDSYLMKWGELKNILQNSNICWKDIAIMIKAEGVHKMLTDVNANDRAEEFYHKSVFQIREEWKKKYE